MSLLSRANILFSTTFKPRWKFMNEIKYSQRILELGCGQGLNFRILKKIGSNSEFYGLDIINKDNIDDNIIYCRYDLDYNGLVYLPFSDNSMDAILMCHVLEHLKNPLNICKEINRILKPGGKIYIETPNWTTMLIPSFGINRGEKTNGMLNGFNFFDDITHVRPWSLQGLYGYLDECGLKVRKVAKIRVLIRFPLDILKIIYGFCFEKRELIINGVWNIFGWSIYGIGVKDKK